jgi:TetR/AcrR family transcriptional regulator, transcriptional repressor for nem operon
MPRGSIKTLTAQRTLAVAEQLVQTRGYNAFSYADIAKSLGITTATLHYHFPTKADLGKQLIHRYRTQFEEALAEIDAAHSEASEKLKRYVGLHAKVLQDGRMCLCGALAAEVATLPKAMKTELRHFFDANEAWLSAVLAGGRKTGDLHFEGPQRDAARYILDILEGAMLIARSNDDYSRFERSSGRLLAEFTPI